MFKTSSSTVVKEPIVMVLEEKAEAEVDDGKKSTDSKNPKDVSAKFYKMTILARAAILSCNDYEADHITCADHQWDDDSWTELKDGDPQKPIYSTRDYAQSKFMVRKVDETQIEDIK